MNLTNLFSWTTIAVSLALLSGLALGHTTEQAMQPRLAGSTPLDPVERFGLGQNAFETANVAVTPVYEQGPEYVDTSYQIGRYVNGARVLTPFEPARKIDRVRLEQLQAWNDQNFDDAAHLYDENSDYDRVDIADHEPIDVGAVEDAPESAVKHAVRHVRIDTSATKQNGAAAGVQQIPVRSASSSRSVISGS